VTVERIGQARGLPASLDLSAFRIVQEALTNVVKHSGADRCHVMLQYGVDSLWSKSPIPGPAAVRDRTGQGHRPGGSPCAERSRRPGWKPARNGASVPAGARVLAGAGPTAAPGRPGPLPGAPPVRVGTGPDRAGHGIIGMRERVSPGRRRTARDAAARRRIRGAGAAAAEHRAP